MSLPLPGYCGKAASSLKYLASSRDPCSRTHAAAMPGRCYDLIYLGPPPLAWFPSGCLRLISSHMRLSRGRVAALSQTLDYTGAPELMVTWTAGHIAGSAIITANLPNLPSLCT